MKRLLFLFLTAVLLLALSACGDEENQTGAGTTTTTASVSSTVSSNAETDGTDNETTTTISQDPVTTTHTHLFADATCRTPKKCACGATEGNVAAHVLEGETCKWCKQVVAVNPGSFNADITYSCISRRYDNGESFSMPADYDCYVITFLKFNGSSSTQDACLESETPITQGYRLPFHHNGKYYGSVAQGSGINGVTSYKIVDSEIVLTAPIDYMEGTVTIHFQLLSNGTLKVVSLSGTPIHEKAEIKVGTIFHPNSKPFPQE